MQRCVRTTDIDEVGDNTPPHRVRDARQLEPRRLLQGDVDPAVVRAADRATSASTRAASTSPCSPAARGAGRRRGAGDLGGRCSATPASTRPGRINPLGATTTGGPTARPVCAVPTPRSSSTSATSDGTRPFADIPEFVEIWNNVFMTLRPRRAKASYRSWRSATSTPAWASSASRCSSTGTHSVWETDELRQLLDASADPLGSRRPSRRATPQRSLRIVTDHLRAAWRSPPRDPSGRVPPGLLLRKLLRRAVRHAELLTDTDQGLAAALIEATAGVSEVMGLRWPDIGPARPATGPRDDQQGGRQVRQDAGQGVENLHEVADETSVFDGDLAFRLADALGFPAELSAEEAQRIGLTDRRRLAGAATRSSARSSAAARGG